MKYEENNINIAENWIAMTRFPSESSDEVFDLGFKLNTLAYDDPESAWAIINIIITKLSDECFLEDSEEGGANLAANLGAGPLEILISQYGVDFIDRIEIEATRNERLKWILGCVWKNSSEDEIWTRVRKAACGISR